jgi:hypothetical protein
MVILMSAKLLVESDIEKLRWCEAADAESAFNHAMNAIRSVNYPYWYVLTHPFSQVEMVSNVILKHFRNYA